MAVERERALLRLEIVELRQALEIGAQVPGAQGALEALPAKRLRLLSPRWPARPVGVTSRRLSAAFSAPAFDVGAKRRERASIVAHAGR
jgi:hypothetical protein